MRTDDWEAVIGRQVRELRLRSRRRQRDLAGDANVSVAALQRLEAGKGSSLTTLVAVLRALDREAWLRQLAPPLSVSPMEALRERRRVEARAVKRVSARGGASMTTARSTTSQGVATKAANTATVPEG